jgi:Protein of unknown function (DUF3500)
MTSPDHEMTAATKALLASLPPEPAQLACFPFSDPARIRWSYLPGPRPGIALSGLGTPARKAAHRLLATVLSRPAFAQAVTIMALEEVLDIDEQGRRGRRSDGYHVAVFGTPGDDSWAWRFEGHHLSVNVTVTNGQPIAAPLFMGANPAQVRHDGQVVIAPLLREEKLARALIDGLPARLRAQAAIAGPAPADIITASAPAAPCQLQPPGVPASRLPGQCRDLLNLLLGTYLGRLAPHLASTEHDRITGSDPAFAWAGGQSEGEASYYRIQAPGLLIEYQNSQRGHGHAHTVIRRPGSDFGTYPPTAGSHRLLRATRRGPRTSLTTSQVCSHTGQTVSAGITPTPGYSPWPSRRPWQSPDWHHGQWRCGRHSA